MTMEEQDGCVLVVRLLLWICGLKVGACELEESEWEIIVFV